MEYRSIKGFTGLGQMGFLFAFVGFGAVLAGAVQAFFALQMLPAGAKITDTDVLLKAMFLPQNLGLVRASQVLGSMLLMFVPAVMWSFVCHGKNVIWLGFSKHINVFQILLAFMIIFVAGIDVNPLSDFTKYVVAHLPSIDVAAKKMEALYNKQATALSNITSMQEYIVALFIMAFFPAMFEEVFFRGTLQNMLVRWSQKPMLSIILTSILFSLVHSSIYLFLSRALLGFVLGLMFYKTKNIWVNIIAHFLNNTFVLTSLYIMQQKTGKVDLDKLEPSIHWSVGIAAMIVLIGLFSLLTKYSIKNRSYIVDDENALMEGKDRVNNFANHLN